MHGGMEHSMFVRVAAAGVIAVVPLRVNRWYLIGMRHNADRAFGTAPYPRRHI